MSNLKVEDSMTVSPNRKARKSLGRKNSAKSLLTRFLRLESLERRELMASDVAAPFHNYLYGQDVDGDSSITPLDALVVINALNSEGSGSLAGKDAPTDRRALVDTDGDNFLSPLDALTVINAINNGEGTGELAELKYEFFAVNADGSIGRNLDPNPSDTVSEAQIGTGEKFIIRTEMADLRPLPAGVFSAYHDLNFTNADGSNTERLQLQWGEYQLLKLTLGANNQGNIGVLSGAFSLQYGSNKTAAIQVAKSGNAVDSDATALNIQTAIEALPGVGAGNVKVTPNTLDSTVGYNFDIYFVNSEARTDIPNPTIVDSTLAVTTGTITPTISGITNPSPAQASVLRAALNYTPNPAQVPLYVNGPNGVLDTSELATSGKSAIRLLGGFSNSTATVPKAQNFRTIVDTLFVAGSAGVVNVAGTISALPTNNTPGADNLGIALYNARGVYLTSTQVVLPTATVTILDRLTAVTDTFSLAEDSAVTTFNVVNNDVDRFGSSRGIVSVTQPSTGGTVAFDANGQSIRFTPSKDFNGNAVFTYTIKNNLNDQATGTVTIAVTPVNDPPVAVGTAFSVAEDSSALVLTPAQLFTPGPANESSQVVTLSIVTGPSASAGTASIVGGNLNFTPAADFNGTAVIVVKGTDDGTGTNNTNSTVTITVTPVNDAPVVLATQFSILEDAVNPLTISASQIFSPGPSNESSQTLTLAIVSQPASGGTASINTSGALVFTPTANFFGTVNLVVSATDNGTTNGTSDPKTTAATLTITVTPVNDAPIAVADTGTAARFNAIGMTNTSTLLDVMRNDSPGPNESSIDTIKIKPFTTSTTALGGTVSLNADRTRVVYLPPASTINKVDSFTYTIEDSAGLTSSAQAEVFIFPPVLPFAIDNSLNLTEVATDTATTIDVIGDDLINDGSTRKLLSVTQPASGTGSVAINDNGTPADQSDDKVVYTAPAHYFGSTTFTYTMNDTASGSNPSTATVFVTVSEVNDSPVAVGRTASGTEDTVLTILGSDITNGLSRGPFEDAQTLTVTAASVLTSGAGSVAVQNGNIVFSPAANVNGTVLVSYTVTDNGTTNGVADPKSSTSTLTITLAAVNDAPVTTSKSFTTAEDTAVTIAISNVTANDTPGPANESSQTISFVALSGTINTAKGGTVTQSGNSLIYTPAANFNGSDTFTYQISDDGSPSLTTTGTVTINVTEVNDAPVATALRRDVYASVATAFDLTTDLAGMSRGAANESGQTLRVSRVIPKSGMQGTVSVNADGKIIYTAPLGASGTDSFDYEVIDNGTTNGVLDAKTSIATFTVNILPFIPSTIRGTVYVDDYGTANDKYDRGFELPLGGVEVTLTSVADPNIPGSGISVTKMTHADGSYEFTLLPPGAYTVVYAVPELTADGQGANSFTRSIVAPGGVDAVYDFGVLGINPRYGSILENLASNFYGTDGSRRTKGVYAAVGSDGRSAWTMRRDGYDTDDFQEVVLSADLTKAYLTSVRGANHDVYTAVLGRNQFVQMAAENGMRLVRIFAMSNELAWTKINLAAPPVNITARGYLDTVDSFFTQEKW